MTAKDFDLNDGREVWLNGKRVEDLNSDRMLHDTLTFIHAYYDLQESNQAEHTYVDTDGQRYSTTFLTPKTVEDLQRKRAVYRDVAASAYGMLGRTPDFINSGVAILPSYADALGQSEKTDFAQNVRDWSAYIKANDLFVSHALQNPQIDRQQTLAQVKKTGKGYAGVWVKEERADGIVVQGAKMVNTLAPLADELLIFNTPTLAPGDDEFALALAMPTNTPGIKIIGRKPNSKYDYTLADYPLSNAFDEIDTYIVFEDIFVPWERVFVYNDVAKSNAFFGASGLFNNTAHQDEVRGVVKLEFITALAFKVAKGLGLDGFLNVQDKLGLLSMNLELIRGTVAYSEFSGHLDHAGVFVPNLQALVAVRAQLTGFYDQAVTLIQEFAAGSIVAVPDMRDFGAANGDILREAMTSELLSAEERAILLNLAWDITGESFGQRQRTYEFLHGGNPMWIRSNHWRDEEISLGNEMVDLVLQRAADSLLDE